LPEKNLVVKSDLGKREVQLTITLIIKQKFKIICEFRYIHNNGIFFELSYNIGLLFFDFNPGVEKLEDQGGNATDFTGKKTTVVVVGSLEYPGQPVLDVSSEICLN
jgi:hypothetical protein